MKKILDSGYVTLVESWGSDERIVEAARMSTGKGFKGWGPACVDCAESVAHVAAGCSTCVQCGLGGPQYQGDERLLRYLYENKHATPFEMAGVINPDVAPTRHVLGPTVLAPLVYIRNTDFSAGPRHTL